LKYAWGLAVLAVLVTHGLAQTNCDEGAGVLKPGSPGSISQDDLIQKFAANESAFKQARNSYTYTQDVSIQTVRRAGLRRVSVSGEYRLVSEISFDDHGRIVERVTFAPRNTLRDIMVTKDDLDDIRTMGGFFLTPSELPQYAFYYAGRQRVDELDTFAFDVSPKRLQKDHRYFEGRIWVDAQDFAIVKTCGKQVPEHHSKKEVNVSPRFVTYRQQIDGRYWFPTYSRSDDMLYMGRTQAQIREVIKYTGFQRVAAR